MTRYKLWTGPCDVDRVAALIETAGGLNVLRGTEHVYYDVQHSPGWDGFCVADKAFGRSDISRPVWAIGRSEVSL